MIAGEDAAVNDRDHRREPATIDTRGTRSSAAYSIAVSDGAAGVTVLVLGGELDLAAAPVLRARLDGAASGHGLVADLTETTFIDSAVLKELLRARAELDSRGVRLVLAGVPPPVRRLLELTSTSELFEEAPDAATAVTRLSG
jgi:anti-sigma B factor antagonist